MSPESNSQLTEHKAVKMNTPKNFVNMQAVQDFPLALEPCQHLVAEALRDIDRQLDKGYDNFRESKYFFELRSCDEAMKLDSLVGQPIAKEEEYTLRKMSDAEFL